MYSAEAKKKSEYKTKTRQKKIGFLSKKSLTKEKKGDIIYRYLNRGVAQLGMSEASAKSSLLALAVRDVEVASSFPVLQYN